MTRATSKTIHRRSPAARVAKRPNRDATLRPKHRRSESTAPYTDHLSTYFRDLGAHGLLTPEQERLLARDLEEAEIRTWAILLSNPTTVEFLLNLIEVRLDNSLTEFRKVRRSAAVARKARTKVSRNKLRLTATDASHPLRALDLDRQHVAALIAELERHAVGASHPRQHLPFNPKTQAFRDYVDDVMKSYQHAARLRDQFVRANLRLVVTMARRYDRGAMPLSDLIQEGNLGLMHAVSRFDYRRGLRFSTYACWWIRHAIGRALADKSRSVRVPVHMIEAQQQLAKVRQQLIRTRGREPTRSELSTESGMPLHKLNQMTTYLLGTPLSFDAPVGGSNDGRSLADVLTDPSADEWKPVDELTAQVMQSRVLHLMKSLSPIEADVLKQRFGLLDDQERTFREIGDQYHLSRERIRQIQNAALHKLRRALDRDGDRDAAR